MYALWEQIHKDVPNNWVYADASAHRLISDLSIFVGSQAKHRIIAAGDLNILNRYGEHGNKYWGARYGSIFSRMSAIGLPFLGPQFPNGRQADPWPEELPRTSNDVPTYHTTKMKPSSATRQLDFVFASKSLTDEVGVKALNEPEDWGPSDHCRVEITVK
jgi:hypothetical protein